RRFVEAALRFADLVGDVADVDNALAVKLCPVIKDANDIGARARLNGRGDTSLDVVAVDGLDVELHAERFLALCSNLSSKQLVGSRNEVVPAQPMERRDLSVRGGATGGENSRHPHPGRDCAAARKFYETTRIQACHSVLSSNFFVEARLYGHPRPYSRARWGAGAHCSGRKAWLGGLKTKLRSSLVARAASAQRQAFYSARKGAVWYWSTMIPVPCAWRYHIFKTRFRVPV